MVFRKDSKIDAFQRQISALRQQLGTVPEELEGDDLYEASDIEHDEDPSDRGSANGGPVGFASASVEARATPAYDSDRELDRDRDRFTSYSVATATRMPEPEPPMPYVTPIADAQTSVIAHDTTWKGDLQSDGTIHIHGRVEGSIRAKQDVFVAEEADVDATITATNVVIAGLVKGSIRCGARFEILPQGRVTGEVQAPTLVVHDGAAVTGQFRMGAGEGTEAAKPAVVQRRARSGSGM